MLREQIPLIESFQASNVDSYDFILVTTCYNVDKSTSATDVLCISTTKPYAASGTRLRQEVPGQNFISYSLHLTLCFKLDKADHPR